MIIKKAVALLCVFMLVFTCSCTDDSMKSAGALAAEQVVYTQKASSVRKNETVYANLSESGVPLAVTVTDWIHTNETQVYADDASDLSDIVNLKDDSRPALPLSGGNSLRWYMDSCDVYYSGTPAKRLPVEIDITYYLDNVEISPQELAGKSGRVRAEMQMTNTVFSDVTIGSEKVRMFLPVAVLGLAVLDEARFSAVEVKNGMVLSDASKEIAVTVCFPGMNESLNLESMGLDTFGNCKITDNCGFSARAVDFTLGNMYYLVVPLCAFNYDGASPNAIGDLRNNIENLNKIVKAVTSADFTAVTSALSKSPDSVKKLEKIATDSSEIFSSNKELMNLLAKYLTPENIEAFGSLLDETDKASALEALELLSDPAVKQFIESLPGLMEKTQTIMPVLENLEREMQDEKIKAQLDNMPQTLANLGTLLSSLEENRELLDALSKAMDSGTFDNLEQVLTSLDGADLSGDVEQYNGVIAHSDELLERLEAWLNYGAEYRVFTLAKPDMQTNLLFIYQTKSIRQGG